MLHNIPSAVLAEHASPEMSSRYQFVSSNQIVSMFAEEGWMLEKAQTASPRKRDPLYAKHMLDFRNPELGETDGAVPRIIVVNSHDGTSSARVASGVYRFVCSNGLVVGTTIAQESVRHTGDAAAELIHRMRDFARQAERTGEIIQSWSKKQLSKPQRNEFARFASILRWGDAQRYQPEELLMVRRAEDDRGDLWTTFNRVQENTVRGGIEGLSRSGRSSTSRPLSDISRSVSYNANLWRLAEEVAATW